MGAAMVSRWASVAWLSALGVGCAGATPAPQAPLTSAPGAEAATPLVIAGETYKYCAGTVTEWEEHKCIWELTAEQQKRRSYSQRLVYRGGRLERFETVTGSGAIYKSDTSFTNTFHYQGAHIAEWSDTNRNGVPKGGGALSEGGRLVLWKDHLGRPRTKKDSRASGLRRTLDARGRVLSYTWVDSAGQATPFEKVFSTEVTRNQQGAVVSERYFGAQGEPVVDSSGAHHIAYVVDAHGLETERRYFDVQDQPTLSQWAHLVRTRYDEVGNPVDTSYFDLEGRPALSAKEGAARMHYTRDARGNETKLELFDTSGQPVIGPWHYASRQRRFDEHDLPFEWAFFGPDGAPLRLSDLGDASMRQTRDAHGNVISERFFDEKGVAMLGTDGYHGVEIAYDARDNATSYRYMNVAGAPVTVKQSYYSRELTYDGDRLIRVEYFDVNAQPVNAFGRYAVTEIVYALDGSEAERRNLDVSSSPRLTCNGQISQGLQNEIMEQAARVRSCYEHLLRVSPKAAGKLLVELRIDATGQVTHASLLKDELAEPDLSSCVLGVMRTSFATAPTNGCAVVNVPLNFQPKPSAP